MCCTSIYRFIFFKGKITKKTKRKKKNYEMLLLFFKNHNKKNYRLVLPPLPPPRPFPPRPRLLPPRGARPPRGDEDINKFCTGKTLEFELSSVKACSSALS